MVGELCLFAGGDCIRQLYKLPEMDSFSIDLNVRLPTAIALVPCYAKIA